LSAASQQNQAQHIHPKPPEARPRIFFPGLNLVRAYAALAVIVWHEHQFHVLYHIPIADRFFAFLDHIFIRGDDGVILFFVLSGFLITYLLLAEHQRTGTIAVGKFYVRRILRIWPLYYLLVLLGFLIIPLCLEWKHYRFSYHDESFGPILISYLLLVPNVAFALWTPAIPIAHLWSIGVEEQFYLIWPALMKGLARWALLLILAVIGIKVALMAAEIHYREATFNWRRGVWTPAIHRFFLINNNLRLDCMAMGGLAAYIGFHARGAFRQFIYHPLMALLSLGIFGWIAYHGYRPINPYGGIGIVALYAAVILCAAGNPGLSPKWIPRSLDYLGRISYGIYMYHVPVIFCLVVTLQKNHVTWHTGDTITQGKRGLIYKLPAEASVWRNLALLAIVLSLTIAVATISFYGFEKRFLRAKRRFTVVPSGSPDVAHV
jgi:peptidoglycan/LPS O-acetylase OafA/YrhL